MPVAKPRFELDLNDEKYRQMVLDLDLPEVEAEGISPEEARERSEAGRSALFRLKGTGNQPEWFERFEALVNGGWPWRQAGYIAWASMPKDGRSPETQEELAKKFLNLTSDRAISTWRKRNPTIETMIALLQSAELWEHRADSFKNLIDGMKRSGEDYKFFNHLKLFMEMSGDYIPLTQLAAVLKRKAGGGPHEVDEETVDLLAKGVEELREPPDPLRPSGTSPKFGQASNLGEEDDGEE
jgi:hypothetical protein